MTGDYKASRWQCAHKLHWLMTPAASWTYKVGRCWPDNTVRETQAAAALFIYTYIYKVLQSVKYFSRRGESGAYISTNTSWASGVSHPGHLNQSGDKVMQISFEHIHRLLHASARQFWHGSQLPNITHQVEPVEQVHGLAWLGFALLPERMIINFAVWCQVCGRGDIRLVFWIRNLYLVGVWFSEDKRTMECGFATRGFVLKMTFWMFGIIYACMIIWHIKLKFFLSFY
jgi:hypothetical protein